MAYKITDKCIGCGAYAGACPVSCISQGDDKYNDKSFKSFFLITLSYNFCIRFTGLPKQKNEFIPIVKAYILQGIVYIII